MMPKLCYYYYMCNDLQISSLKGKNYDYEKLKKRDSSLDILRIIAVFTVLSVHFFLHNGFYSQTIEGTRCMLLL